MPAPPASSKRQPINSIDPPTDPFGPQEVIRLSEAADRGRRSHSSRSAARAARRAGVELPGVHMQGQALVVGNTAVAHHAVDQPLAGEIGFEVDAGRGRRAGRILSTQFSMSRFSAVITLIPWR